MNKSFVGLRKYQEGSPGGWVWRPIQEKAAPTCSPSNPAGRESWVKVSLYSAGKRKEGNQGLSLVGRKSMRKTDKWKCVSTGSQHFRGKKVKGEDEMGWPGRETE